MKLVQSIHVQMVRALVKPGEQIQSELTPENCDLIHAALGIAGEAGELVDAAKKVAIYRQEPDMANFIEELGDMEFYLQQLRDVLGISREDCLQANIAKLSVRYPNFKYTDAKAKERLDKADNNV